MTSAAAPTTSAVVLAAGLGTRFGDATKQLAEVDGRPLVAHAVAIALHAGMDEVVVVVGHDAGRVRAALPADTRVRAVENPVPEAGMGSSLRAGVQAVAPSVDRLVVLLGDQPGVDPALVRAVLDALDDHDAARVRYRDGAGHPVAFARTAFARLTGLEGDVGARDLLEELATAEVTIDAPRPPDVDTPADLPDRSPSSGGREGAR